MQATRDMTEGKPMKLLLLFALPLLLGNLFQQFYTIVDTVIVGQKVGIGALAAIGAADWLNWLFLWLVMGMAQGFSILFSQYYGEKNERALRRSVGNAVLLSAAASVLLTVLGELAVEPVLHLLHTSSDIFGGSVLYLRILFAGLPVILFYNLAASVLRALGDSRSPLIAMVIAACTNIGLDLLFVAGLRWGIAGAAIATVIAQGLSLLYCMAVIRRIRILHLGREDFSADFSLMGKLLRLGVPVMMQNAIISVGGMVLQSVINREGVLFIAGFTATNKLYGLLEVAAISYGSAITTYIAQNRGAGKYGRIRSGMRCGIGVAYTTSLLVSAVMLLAGRHILMLFVRDEKEAVEQVLDIAYHYLSIMSVFLLILYALHVYRCALQGLGDTVTPMISGMAEFVMRVSAAILLPRLLGQEGIFYAEILAWSGACVILVTVYYIKIRSVPRE